MTQAKHLLCVETTTTPPFFPWKRVAGMLLITGSLSLASIEFGHAHPPRDRDSSERDGSEQAARDRGPRERDGERRGPRDRDARERGDGDRGPGRPSPKEMMQRMPILAALDADADGTISEEELDNASAALRKLDKNEDGSLTFDELRPQADFPGRSREGDRGDRPRMRRPDSDREGAKRGDDAPTQRERRDGVPPEASENPERFVRMIFQRRDANSDDALTGDEIPEPMRARLERIDSNADQSVSREELLTAMKRMRDGNGPDAKGPRNRERMSGQGQPRAEEGGKTPRRPPSKKDSKSDSKPDGESGDE
ncbi:EF hand [Novipirellula galeiformis]|uniref:EF hand n=1 Tax=Novipirellula galeiformis TaxID=2528004 RepID=A0A5C6CJF0_9BACT|nr:hypothetical protein [Novipirellula galeiformis]TWU24973.1 EF hand [Novipirellula galeiformis]